MRTQKKPTQQKNQKERERDRFRKKWWKNREVDVRNVCNKMNSFC